MHSEQASKESTGKAYTREEALQLDGSDSLRHLRSEFIIPTKDDLKRKTLSLQSTSTGSQEELCVYLCGNSLGLQPRRSAGHVSDYMKAWATKGVFGHFKAHEDSIIPPFVKIDDVAAQRMAPIVGALVSEVAVMETLSANLHLMMASFYRPTQERYKIILEGKAFPSDHYAVESQIRHHGRDSEQAMILIEPLDSTRAIITTCQVMATIDEHASTTALILLPGVQYYTGQYFDIQAITAHAHSHGITIGWDLAHAVGNVELQLHDWDVDFAVWCSYKYLNCGPGAIGGLFVHDKHSQVDKEAIENGHEGYRPRLSGWWGGDKATRFQMGREFIPIPGAAGFQVGNPCALAICPLLAALEIFAIASMPAVRSKSIMLTSYLEELLQRSTSRAAEDGMDELYWIITPPSTAERGAQLSIRLQPGLLEGVMVELEEQGVVVDERKPDVVRVAPAPLYNTFSEVWDFVAIFDMACRKANSKKTNNSRGLGVLGGTEDKG
ncbi:MAG: hypothetical protein L6R38_007057 [Xanthoria sp. 2 TBL-2021]|nr:MAG: hypothetical protein L6R38_007057 [Xanthoria sp. 2 TBL-2021]